MAVRRERPSFERIRSGRFTLPTTQFRSFEGRCPQSETGRSFTAPKRGDRHRLDIRYLLSAGKLPISFLAALIRSCD